MFLLTRSKLTAGGILGGRIFTHSKVLCLDTTVHNVESLALILAFTYTYSQYDDDDDDDDSYSEYSQYNRRGKASFFISFDVKYLPGFILIVTFILNGVGGLKIRFTDCWQPICRTFSPVSIQSSVAGRIIFKRQRSLSSELDQKGSTFKSRSTAPRIGPWRKNQVLAYRADSA